jgi:hypothetical protein
VTLLTDASPTTSVFYPTVYEGTAVLIIQRGVQKLATTYRRMTYRLPSL